jgi:peptidoglycan hydrolase-like protein with peptidoglycan-binding domain
MQVQRSMAKLGYSPGPIDGILGPITENAIREFRLTYFLGDHTCIDHTLLALIDSAPWIAQKTNLKIDLDENSVRALQRQLLRLGYDPGPPDGLLGPKTRAAIGRYQRDLGFLTAQSFIDIPSIIDSESDIDRNTDSAGKDNPPKLEPSALDPSQFRHERLNEEDIVRYCSYYFQIPVQLVNATKLTPLLKKLKEQCAW